MDPYLTAKWLHILSSTVLFGTGIGTAFQMVWAMHNQDTRVIAKVAGGVVMADWLFTIPAGLLQPATGLWLIYIQGWSLTEPWLVAAYFLYVIAFICWAPVVHLQIRIRNLAAKADQDNAQLTDGAKRAYHIWFALGWPAFAALMIIFWLMVAKPDLGVFN